MLAAMSRSVLLVPQQLKDVPDTRMLCSRAQASLQLLACRPSVSREAKLQLATRHCMPERICGISSLLPQQTSIPAHRRGAPGLVTRQPSSKKKADELTRPIVKMTEKFSRRAELPAHLDVAKRVFYSAQGQIRLDYHYAGGRRAVLVVTAGS